MSLFFEWDETKARMNLQKHNVSFEEASTVFGDSLSITIDDPLHSLDEHRFIIVGQSIRSKILVVVHTERNDRIRIISAREATHKEKKKYETSTEK